MNIQTAIGYLKHGYRIRRGSWYPEEYLELHSGRIKKYYVAPPGCSYLYGWSGWSAKIDDLAADDWELILKGISNDYGTVQYEDDK